MRAVWLVVALAGCDKVFGVPVPGDAAPPGFCDRDPETRLCLTFESADTTGAADGSTYGNDAVFTNVALARRDDARAIELGPTSEVALPSDRGLDLPGPLTVALWVEAASMQSGPVAIVFDNHNQYGLAIAGDTQIQCTVAGGVVDATVASSLAAGWHHIACVKTPTTVELFVDSDRVASAPATFALTTGDPSQVRIGQDAGAEGAALPFTGRLDDVFITARALEPADLRMLMNGN